MLTSNNEIGDHGSVVRQDLNRNVASGGGFGPTAPNKIDDHSGSVHLDHSSHVVGEEGSPFLAPYSEIAGNGEASGTAIDALSPMSPMPAARKPIPSDGGQIDQLKTADAGQNAGVDLANFPGNGEGEVSPSTTVRLDQISGADPATIDEIREQWRRRQAWHRAEKALTLQAKALCRRLAAGDLKEAEKMYSAAYGKGSHDMADIALAATFPLVEARDSVAKHRAAVEKRLVKLAKQLPVAPYVESVRGVGLASLAAIVGEAGDLSNYSTPAKLWKRMGLAVMPDGGRQRRISGDAALEHGYSPTRRSVVWNIGACIVKAGGPLKAIYDARKVYETERVETKAHAHNRAQRYIEKRFVRDLWVAWRKAEGTTILQTSTKAVVSPSAIN